MPEVKTPQDAVKHNDFKNKNKSIKDKLAVIEDNKIWASQSDEDSLPSYQSALNLQKIIDDKRKEERKKRARRVSRPIEKLNKINVCLYDSQYQYIQNLVETTNTNFTNIVREIIRHHMQESNKSKEATAHTGSDS